MHQTVYEWSMGFPSEAIELQSGLATDRLHLTIHAWNVAPTARRLAASLFHHQCFFGVFFLSFLAFSRFQPPWHTHTHLSMWVMSDNLWSVPQVVQSQTKTHQFWTNICLSSSTLIRFPHLSIRFHPLSLLSLAIVCLSFSCLTCCLSTLCPLEFIHVKLSCSCNAHLARSYFLPPLTFFIILTFCVSVFEMPNHSTSSQHTHTWVGNPRTGPYSDPV